MGRIKANEPCPCGSGQKYKRCCGPLHRGHPSPTPNAVMRARYCAYAIGLVEYIIRTTDPTGPMWQTDKDRWRADIEDFCRNTEFIGLTLSEITVNADHAYVQFSAQISQNGVRTVMTERSSFSLTMGEWRYVSGVHPDHI